MFVDPQIALWAERWDLNDEVLPSSAIVVAEHWKLKNDETKSKKTNSHTGLARRDVQPPDIASALIYVASETQTLLSQTLSPLTAHHPALLQQLQWSCRTPFATNVTNETAWPEAHKIDPRLLLPHATPQQYMKIVLPPQQCKPTR